MHKSPFTPRKPQDFRILMFYPNLHMSALMPQVIGIFTALFKQEGYTIDLFDCTYYKDIDSINLGKSTNGFQNVWAHRINLNTLDASGSSEDIKVVGHLVPHTDDNYDLGEPDKEWRNAYFDGFVSLDKFE